MTLSIITVNLNNEMGLKRTISSVAAQQNACYEYIVIDGASSDLSVNVIEDYLHIIQKYVSEKDEGVYDAMNKGINLASGKYLLFLNSGDCFVDEFVVAKSLEVLKNEEATIFYTDTIVVDENKKHAYYRNYPEVVDTTFFMQSTISHQGAFIKKEAFRKLGLYNTQYKLASDWAFFLLAATNKIVFKYIKGFPLTYFVLHGLSADHHLGINERLEIIKTTHPDLLPNYLQLNKKTTIAKKNNIEV